MIQLWHFLENRHLCHFIHKGLFYPTVEKIPSLLHFWDKFRIFLNFSIADYDEIKFNQETNLYLLWYILNSTSFNDLVTSRYYIENNIKLQYWAEI